MLRSMFYLPIIGPESIGSDTNEKYIIFKNIVIHIIY